MAPNKKTGALRKAPAASSAAGAVGGARRCPDCGHETISAAIGDGYGFECSNCKSRFNNSFVEGHVLPDLVKFVAPPASPDKPPTPPALPVVEPPAPAKVLTTADVQKIIPGKITKKSEKPEPPKTVYPKFDDLGPNAPPFEEYFERHVGTIKDVQAILAKSLNDEPMLMDTQIRSAESYLGTMRSIESWADSYLDVAEHLALGKMPSRANDFTDLDRQKSLAAAVARERRFRNVVRGIRESIETRISYGQSRLRMIERNHG